MSQQNPAPEPAEIAGRYQVVRKLGAGAFGTVYKAKDKILGRMLAIKTIRLEGLAAAGASLDEVLDRFKREAIGSLFAVLPVDPINTSSGNFYLTFILGSWALSVKLESQKFINSVANTDGGSKDDRFEIGSNLALNANLGGTVPGNTVPTAPQSPNTVAGSQQITLTWSAPVSDGGSAITSYKVYRDITPNPENLLESGGCSALGNVLTCTDTGLTNGTIFYYKISAVNSIGEGAKSSEVSAATLVLTLSTPYVWVPNADGNAVVKLNSSTGAVIGSKLHLPGKIN